MSTPRAGVRNTNKPMRSQMTRKQGSSLASKVKEAPPSKPPRLSQSHAAAHATAGKLGAPGTSKSIVIPGGSVPPGNYAPA